MWRSERLLIGPDRATPKDTAALNRLFSGAQSSVGTTVARRMMSPPMVGVPRFPWWLAGPSARIT